MAAVSFVCAGERCGQGVASSVRRAAVARAV